MMVFEQNNKIILDDKGRRWAKCLICGTIDLVGNFATYGGLGQMNKGKCIECVWKMDGYKVVKDNGF